MVVNYDSLLSVLSLNIPVGQWSMYLGSWGLVSILWRGQPYHYNWAGRL